MVWSAVGVFGVSRSGPLLGFWSVTVWSAVGVLECDGLVRCWGFRVSRSLPLLGFLARHGLVRCWGVELLGFQSVCLTSSPQWIFGP